MTRYTLTPAQCKAMLLHIPKSEIRFYLIGMHVAADGIVSATDGARALRLRVGMEGPGAEGIIPRELVAQGAKQKHAAVFVIADGRATLLPTGQSMPLVDGKFPDVNRVCPMTTADKLYPHRGDFNLHYQLDARAALDLLKNKPINKAPCAVKWKTVEAERLDGCAFYRGDDFAMALMPVRQ